MGIRKKSKGVTASSLESNKHADHCIISATPPHSKLTGLYLFEFITMIIKYALNTLVFCDHIVSTNNSIVTF